MAGGVVAAEREARTWPVAGECMVLLPCVWREVMSARNCFVLNRRITARSAAARSLNVWTGGREEDEAQVERHR